MPGLAQKHAASGTSSLLDRIDAALPQTQCTRCGYPDCRSYAAAIADSRAAINQCPPGGAEGIRRLAAITGDSILPLNEEHGAEGSRHLAVIDETWCIGCTLCIKACPTDAILGANKHMHTVIAEHCTGCELCLPVCPVDCITLANASGPATGWQAWSSVQASHARMRHASRQARLANPAQARRTHPPAGSGKTARAVAPNPQQPPASAPTPVSADDAKQARIAAILAKARAQRDDYR